MIRQKSSSPNQRRFASLRVRQLGSRLNMRDYLRRVAGSKRVDLIGARPPTAEHAIAADATGVPARRTACEAAGSNVIITDRVIIRRKLGSHSSSPERCAEAVRHALFDPPGASSGVSIQGVL